MATTESGNQMSVFKINDGERHWVVARDAADAVPAMLDTYGMSLDEYGMEGADPKVEQIPDAQLIKVYEHEPFCDPTPFVEKPAAEWVRSNGRGVFASSCV